jgi:hypothetical protein
MLIVAKSKWERGYMYSIKSAHRVPQRRAKAEQIAEILNREMYKWDSPEDRWRVYEIDQYNTAYETAQRQRFGFREHGKYLVEYTR